MNINEAFPSNFITSDDLQGQDVPVQIADCRLEPVRQENGPDRDKPVLYFAGHQRGLVLNVTNGQAIASLYGDETDAWRGQWITLYPTTCQFGNKTVDCIRVRQFTPGTHMGQTPQGGPPAASPAPTMPAEASQQQAAPQQPQISAPVSF